MLLVEFQVDERGLKKRHNQCAQQMTARPSPKEQQEMLHNNMYDPENVDPKGQRPQECVR